MNNLSYFLFDLCADVGEALDLPVDGISIVDDAPRLPSTTLLNMNRRAMGMENFHQPIFLKKERVGKSRCWEEGFIHSTISRPELTVKDPASSRQCSDSMLLKPRRQPSTQTSLDMNCRAMGMEDFRQPSVLKKERKGKNRLWTEGFVHSTKSRPERTVKDRASNRQRSDSMLPRPKRQPSPRIIPRN